MIWEKSWKPKSQENRADTTGVVPGPSLVLRSFHCYTWFSYLWIPLQNTLIENLFNTAIKGYVLYRNIVTAQWMTTQQIKPTPISCQLIPDPIFMLGWISGWKGGGGACVRVCVWRNPLHIVFQKLHQTPQQTHHTLKISIPAYLSSIWSNKLHNIFTCIQFYLVFHYNLPKDDTDIQGWNYTKCGKTNNSNNSTDKYVNQQLA